MFASHHPGVISNRILEHKGIGSKNQAPCIKFGQHEGRVAVDEARVLHHNQIQPAAPSLPTSGDTILVPNVLQLCPKLAMPAVLCRRMHG
jgi:hypothetical protein